MIKFYFRSKTIELFGTNIWLNLFIYKLALKIIIKKIIRCQKTVKLKNQNFLILNKSQVKILVNKTFYFILKKIKGVDLK